jgi:hypothetical protein
MLVSIDIERYNLSNDGRTEFGFIGGDSGI